MKNCRAVSPQGGECSQLSVRYNSGGRGLETVLGFTRFFDKNGSGCEERAAVPERDGPAGGEMNHRRDACATGVRQFLWRRSGQAMIAATEEEGL